MKFCPTKDLSLGYCCSLTENCPKEFGFCSTDFNSTSMQQFMCPIDAMCGLSYKLYPTETVQTVTLSTIYYVNQSICHYTFIPPTGYSDGDTIYLNMLSLDKVAATINQSKDLKTFGTAYSLTSGSTISVVLPLRAYLTLRASSTTSPGLFYFQYQYIKQKTYSNSTTSSDSNGTSSQESNNSLLYIILSIIIALVVVVALFVGVKLYRRHKEKKALNQVQAEQTDHNETKKPDDDGQTEAGKLIDPEQAQIMDNYYNKSLQEEQVQQETPKLRKHYQEDQPEEQDPSDYEENLEQEKSKRKNNLPKKSDYRSDREASIDILQGSKLFVTDNEGYQPKSSHPRKSQQQDVNSILPPIQNRQRKNNQIQDDGQLKDTNKKGKFFDLPPQAMASTAYPSQQNKDSLQSFHNNPQSNNQLNTTEEENNQTTTAKKKRKRSKQSRNISNVEQSLIQKESYNNPIREAYENIKVKQYEEKQETREQVQSPQVNESSMRKKKLAHEEIFENDVSKMMPSQSKMYRTQGGFHQIFYENASNSTVSKKKKKKKKKKSSKRKTETIVIDEDDDY